jgi:hypothetical protein
MAHVVVLADRKIDPTQPLLLFAPMLSFSLLALIRAPDTAAPNLYSLLFLKNSTHK